MIGRSRSREEWWLFAQAAATLSIARLALRVLPFRVIARGLGLREGASPAPAGTVDGAAPQAELIGWAVRAAAARLPWESTCLVQAVTAAALLRRRRIPATLSLGVARDGAPQRDLMAHAWLQHGDLVLTGQRERAQFTELASFALD